MGYNTHTFPIFRCVEFDNGGTADFIWWVVNIVEGGVGMKIKLPKILRNKTIRFRITPFDPLPFVAFTIEKKGKIKLPQRWYFKWKNGWKKELFD